VSGSHPPGPVTVLPLPGLPEVPAGADLAGLVLAAAAGHGIELADGDCLVVSSKVVSKALGLVWDGVREDAVDAASRRVVAERRGPGGRTRVVEAAAGPVMAAAGVDTSNTGPSGAVLLLPEDPDAEAERLRSALLEAGGLGTSGRLGVVLSDTAGRPWRAGLTDFALGVAGLAVLDDLRGEVDADGRPLVVTARAVADEVAAAADLVKGKADGVPAALVRGLPPTWFVPAGEGARALVRTGPADWFAFGHVEAVRASLGVAPGSADAERVGIPATAPEPLADRVGRVVALSLHDVPDGSADVAVHDDADPPEGGWAEVDLAAPDPYDLGRLVERARVAAASESLRVVAATRSPTATTLRLVSG
jgi:coenzyme F420-0:L-glutamate ligase/coenzyme F420-1:gamma-L-glutamate ligase